MTAQQKLLFKGAGLRVQGAELRAQGSGQKKLPNARGEGQPVSFFCRSRSRDIICRFYFL